MKKILTVLILLLAVSGCSRNLSKLNLEKLNKKLDNKETFILYLTDESDSSNTLKNTLTSVLKDNNINAFYLNTDKLSSTDQDELKKIIAYEDSNIIIFIKDGSENTVLARITDNYISKEKLTEELKVQGYIK
ncbi:MAG: hypothetical protein MR266_01315 [Erysipelotrichaceae bacterium]|nr:hypothetical protein [Erysipelotrichaceae bacterium]